MLETSSSSATSTTFIDFETFMRQEGYHLHLPPEEARERMKEVFSPQSLARFEALMELRKVRPYLAEELYSVVDTLPEATLLLSPQSHIINAAGQQLYRKLKDILTPGMTIADMGCGIASWTRWMAQQFPNVNFVGLDRHDGLMAIASAAEPPSNCQFSLVDFAELSPAYGRFDVVTALLGLDFEPEPIAPDRDSLSALDPTTSQTCDYFQRLTAKAFAGWKRVMRDGGSIMAVLRLVSFESWYACLAGARSVGLCFDAEASCCVAAGNERLPLIVLKAVDAVPPLNLDDLLTWWVKHTGVSTDSQVVSDTAALWRYRRLKDKRVLEQNETQYEDGHFLIQETGLADGIGYVYEYATTLYRRLECVAEDSLEATSRPTFVVPDN